MTDDSTDADQIGIGASRVRPDSWAKVRGEYEFAPDVAETEMLWGVTLRSPHPLARIRTIDLQPAKVMPGVHAALGGWDVPDNRYGVVERDAPVLADEHVRYVGEPVAIVAAENLELARRAAAAIDVDYETREPVTDPLDALNAGTVYRQVKYTHGDPDVVGDVVAEGEYTTPRQDHSFLAPDAGLARPDGRGGVEIIGATQWLQSDQRQIAEALSLPKEMVLVRNSGIGGSFGGRFVLSWQIHGALLAMHTLRPVKMLYTRRETFLARYHRQPSRIWIRHHARRDGTLVKLEAKVLLENGPYMNTAGSATGNASTLIQGPYRIPNADIEGWSVATNNGMTGSLRGFGVVEPMFACESNMDKLAAMLGMDPTELRRKNAMQQGERWIFNQLMDRPAPVEDVIDECLSMPMPGELDQHTPDVRLPGGVCTPSRPRDVVRGVALSAAAKNVCLSEGAPVETTALVRLRDGRVTITCAAAEVGQGFVTVAVQVAQTTLGISDVEINGTSDTTLPPATTTDGQEQTMASGGAVAKASAALRARFLQFCEREYRWSETKLDIRDDCVVNGRGEPLMSVKEAGMGLEFRATETFAVRRTRPIDELNSEHPMHVTFNFSASRCVVDVDAELGLVRVVQMDVAQDAGRVVNPAQAAGQIRGGSLMGMGLAAMEHLQARDGHILNPSWETYMVPTTIDAPTINVRFIENAEPGVPYGMRGIAELPHVQAPPAVMAAIRAATGRQLSGMPASLDTVSGVTSGYQTVDIVSAGQHPTLGPWKAPLTHDGYGPWRARVPGRD
jgi:CO/xanthine dehydrogenase Mo-binding subunit